MSESVNHLKDASSIARKPWGKMTQKAAQEAQKNRRLFPAW
jgi:hypothetical protein